MEKVRLRQEFRDRFEPKLFHISCNVSTMPFNRAIKPKWNEPSRILINTLSRDRSAVKVFTPVFNTYLDTESLLG